MARRKKKVDYFPHFIGGDTMMYIRDTYGNDGYATWFTLLERLALSDRHWIEVDENKRRILASRCRVSDDTLENIIDDLAEMGKFDKGLWEEENILYSEQFVQSVEDAWSRRKDDPASKCELYERFMSTTCEHNEHKNPDAPGDDVLENRINLDNMCPKINKVNKSKENNKKEKQKKENGVVREIFDHFISKENLTSHKSLKSGMRSTINARLNGEWSLDEMKEAIDKYNDLVPKKKSDDYEVYGIHESWTLEQLFKRSEGEKANQILQGDITVNKKDPSGNSPDNAHQSGRDYTEAFK